MLWTVGRVAYTVAVAIAIAASTDDLIRHSVAGSAGTGYLDPEGEDTCG